MMARTGAGSRPGRVEAEREGRDRVPDAGRLVVAEEPVPALGIADDGDEAGDAAADRRRSPRARRTSSWAPTRSRVGRATARGGGGGAVHQADEAVELAARGVGEVAGVGGGAGERRAVVGRVDGDEAARRSSAGRGRRRRRSSRRRGGRDRRRCRRRSPGRRGRGRRRRGRLRRPRRGRCRRPSSRRRRRAAGPGGGRGGRAASATASATSAADRPASACGWRWRRSRAGRGRRRRCRRRPRRGRRRSKVRSPVSPKPWSARMTARGAPRLGQRWTRRPAGAGATTGRAVVAGAGPPGGRRGAGGEDRGQGEAGEGRAEEVHGAGPGPSSGRVGSSAMGARVSRARGAWRQRPAVVGRGGSPGRRS